MTNLQKMYKEVKRQNKIIWCFDGFMAIQLIITSILILILC